MQRVRPRSNRNLTALTVSDDKKLFDNNTLSPSNSVTKTPTDVSTPVKDITLPVVDTSPLNPYKELKQEPLKQADNQLLFSTQTDIDYETEPYVDNDFPCDTRSLYRTEENSEIPSGLHEVTQWLRTTQIAKNPKLFVDGSAAEDVIQGRLGDCWFLGGTVNNRNKTRYIKSLCCCDKC